MTCIHFMWLLAIKPMKTKLQSRESQRIGIDKELVATDRSLQESANHMQVKICISLKGISQGNQITHKCRLHSQH